MILVELYSKDDCHLCDEAKKTLEKVRGQIPFVLKEIKLIEGDAYYDEYKELVPVVHIDKVQAFKYRVNEGMLKFRLLQVSRPDENMGDSDLPAEEEPSGQ